MSESKKELKQGASQGSDEKVAQTQNLEAKQYVPPQGQVDLHAMMGNLISVVQKLSDEVAELKRPSVAALTPAEVQAQRQQSIVSHTQKRVSRGYPVKPGQTWLDLTPAQRREWFMNHENRWKSKYTAIAQRMGNGGGGEMTLSRG
jgi:predicted dithiol-disulfide oxidoreductase (DUF899 family)